MTTDSATREAPAPAPVDDYRLAPDSDAIDHIPGSDGLPYFGKGLRFVFGIQKLAQEHYDRWGEVSRLRAVDRALLMVLGADNWKRVFLDKEQLFSTEMGYAFQLGDFYHGGLLLRDFEEHRLQRHIMLQAFKIDAMRTYVPMMTPIIERHVARFGEQRPLIAAPAIKETLLDVGAHLFVGVDDPAATARLNHAFADIGWGLLSQIKREIPGGGYWRGKRGIRNLHGFFASEIAARRASDQTDMFTHMCKERREDGSYFSDEDIVAHASFLLFAAHDTTASTLNNLVMHSAMDPAWQEKMRAEVLALGKDELAYEDLRKLESIDRAFDETIRLYPPVPIGLRRTVRDTEIGGYRVPAHTLLLLPFMFNHRDPRYWSNPTTWDPDRFSPERQEHRAHPFCYHPFGGGAHKCVGMHFANMLAKVFMFHLLKTYRYRTPPGFQPWLQWLPLPKAVRLPLIVERV